jgi:carbon monoxide dehydrogenase subunit G
VLLTHEFSLPATPPECWRLLTDVETVGRCLPGLSVGRPVDRRYPGILTVQLGPYRVRYTGSVRFLRRSAGSRTAVLEVEGTDTQGDGSAAGTITWRLVPDGPETTRVVVDTELEVTGRVALLSPALVQDASDQVVAGLVRCLEARLSRQGEPAPAGRQAADGPERPSALGRYAGLVAAGGLGLLLGRRLGRGEG